MGMNNRVVDKPSEAVEDGQCPGNSTGFEKVKNIIADKLHDLAEASGEITADQDGQSGVAQYGKQASEWLDESPNTFGNSITSRQRPESGNTSAGARGAAS